jgi:uncharacterized phage protein (TIGR02216 family)
MSEATPWPRLMALSQTYNVTPASFWRLSLKEWRALVAPATDSLTRAAFDALAQRFPDKAR